MLQTTQAADSTFNTVSMYVGFITGITGIVLSIVAMIFAVVVQRESSRVSEQTLKTLAKVESVTERLSADISSLIKAAWDKMLDSEGRSPRATSDLDAEIPASVREGLIQEITSQIQLSHGDDEVKEVSRALEGLAKELEERFEELSKPSKISERFENVVNSLKDSQPLTRELLRILSNGHHLTIAQYGRLIEKSPLSSSLKFLRQVGYIIPLRGYKEDGGLDDDFVYWLHPKTKDSIRAALLVFPVNPREQLTAAATLERVGYKDIPPGVAEKN